MRMNPPMSLNPLKQRLVTSVKLQECQTLCRPIGSIALTASSVSPGRSFSSSQISQDESAFALPRWKETPPKMTAPFRSKPPVLNNSFTVNDSQMELDQAYERVLGPGGDKILTEEVKWLAVTHKSFDHGRRGYNDRLAFFGKRILQLQASLSFINAAIANPRPSPPDFYGRTPFQHEALAGLDGITPESRDLIENSRGSLKNLAYMYELEKVIRWKPRTANNIKTSGEPLVCAQALSAIIGAVALQKGGKYANHVARERVLAPLGLS